MNNKSSYKTKQMDELLGYLKKVEGEHVTVNDICGYFAKEGITVGQTTVYRNLDKLINKGLVAKYTVDGTTSACFEYMGEQNHTHSHDEKSSCYHCKCEKCGKLIHLHCEEIEELIKHIQTEHEFVINHKKTVFYGLCETCRQGE